MSLNRKENIWFLGLPFLFVVLLAVIFFSGWNLTIFRFLNDLSTLTGDRFWALVTLFGDGLICIVIFLPWIRKNPKLVLSVVLAVIVSSLLIHILKRIVDVSRPPRILSPDGIHLIGPFLGKYSFPSGHSAMAFILAGALSFSTKIGWRRLLYISIGMLIAVSRCVVGVHWPLDIIAGAVIGWVLIWLSLRWIGKISWGWQGIGQKVMGFLLILGCVFLLLFEYTGYMMVLFEQRLIAVFLLLIGGYEYLRIYDFDLLKKIGFKKS